MVAVVLGLLLHESNVDVVLVLLEEVVVHHLLVGLLLLNKLLLDLVPGFLRFNQAVVEACNFLLKFFDRLLVIRLLDCVLGGFGQVVRRAG